MPEKERLSATGNDQRPNGHTNGMTTDAVPQRAAPHMHATLELAASSAHDQEGALVCDSSLSSEPS
jgi:hypothetical protein